MHHTIDRIPHLVARAVEIPVNWLLNGIDAPTLVLLYHRVTTLPSDPLGLAVSPGRFRDQLRFLKEHFHIRRFEEPWPRGKKPSVVITFDDGYADNLLEALPILEEVEVPACFFISTETIGSRREYWWDDLERLVLLPERLPSRFESADPRLERAWSVRNPPERNAFFADLQKLLKRFDFQRRESWLRDLRDWAGLPEEGRESHRPMTLEELRRLAGSPWVTIGAHTITHTRLSILPPEVQVAEIKGSKDQLEAWLRRPISVFSYPFGCKPDYSPAAVACCRNSFVKTASSLPHVAHSWSDEHQIPRRYVGDWPVQALQRCFY